MAAPVSPGAWARAQGVSLRAADALPPEPALRRALADGVARGYGGELPPFPGDAALLLIEEGGESAGVLALKPGPGAAARTVLAVAVAPARRGRAVGLRAVVACERRLLRDGVRELYASVPRGNGRGVYFWLRAGYRPLPEPPALAPPGWGGGQGASPEGCGWFYRRLERSPRERRERAR